MFTNWDKALVPFVLAGAGVAVYLGFISEAQAASFGDFVKAAIVPFVQAVLVYVTPNKA